MVGTLLTEFDCVQLSFSYSKRNKKQLHITRYSSLLHATVHFGVYICISKYKLCISARTPVNQCVIAFFIVLATLHMLSAM